MDVHHLLENRKVLILNLRANLIAPSDTSLKVSEGFIFEKVEIPIPCEWKVTLYLNMTKYGLKMAVLKVG